MGAERKQLTIVHGFQPETKPVTLRFDNTAYQQKGDVKRTRFGEKLSFITLQQGVKEPQKKQTSILALMLLDQLKWTGSQEERCTKAL